MEKKQIHFATKMGGYFTVEASLILPFVLGVIFLVIYMFFYKYDRCLMEQDLEYALIEGTYLQDVSSQERVEHIADTLKNTYRDEYFGWVDCGSKVSANLGEITVTGEGYIEFPFSVLRFWEAGDIWDAKAEFKKNVIKKVFGIRSYRKLLGLIDH